MVVREKCWKQNLPTFTGGLSIMKTDENFIVPLYLTRPGLGGTNVLDWYEGLNCTLYGINNAFVINVGTWQSSNDMLAVCWVAFTYQAWPGYGLGLQQ